MIKKLISLVLSTILCLSALTVVSMAEDRDNSIMLQIDSNIMNVAGEEKTLDASPVIIDGRTLLPVRAVVEEMGGSVSWNSETREATLVNGESTIILTVGSHTALLNGVEATLDTAPVIIDSRTFLPIRFIAEGFGYSVDWDGEAKTIEISQSADEVTELTTEIATEATTEAETEAATEPSGKNNALVAYFSATGNTREVAEKIAENVGAYVFEIEAQDPYTSEDIDYSIEDCRANIEQHDDTARPEIANTVENMEDYDLVFLGYPIWWGDAPKIVYTFMESYDFSDKTIVPFCTSGGSGISTSEASLSAIAGGNWLDGERFNSNVSDEDINSWLSELGLK